MWSMKLRDEENVTMFPYQSSTIKSVWSLGILKVSAKHNGRTETFWLNVIAVAPRGEIVGISANSINSIPIVAGDYHVSKIKDVIAARKGPHWKNLPYGTNICEPCDNPKCNQREIGDIRYKSIS
jgi:hypothetical protein